MAVDIYVSSVAFGGHSAEQIIHTAKANDMFIEFSSGMPYREDMQDTYLNAPVRRMAHNYFPAPSHPFVLNLASSNEAIRRRSIDHCINGLQITKKTGSPFFAAHAGFCIDPVPAELGRSLAYENGFDKNDNWSFFLSALQEILVVADLLHTDFLIENNVIATFNLRDGVNPLFCCESSEILKLFNDITHPKLGLLLDTAHLKVSCNSLKLDLERELEKIRPYVSALHHSDNDGSTDSNEPLTDKYWFLPHVKDFNSKVHVIEVKNLSVPEMFNHINLIQQYAAY